jgi:hypothetical protein
MFTLILTCSVFTGAFRPDDGDIMLLQEKDGSRILCYKEGAVGNTAFADEKIIQYANEWKDGDDGAISRIAKYMEEVYSTI